MRRRAVYTIGLTGGIASGKSSARRLLADRFGARAVDADRLGHACYAPGHPCLAQVVAAFGADNVLAAEEGADGLGLGRPLDRRKLGDIVFSDPAQLRKLNAIVWPHIRASLRDQLDVIREEVASASLSPSPSPSSSVSSGSSVSSVSSGSAASASAAPGSSSHPATTVVVVCEAAVLVEAGWQDLFDEIWVVHVSPATACARLMARNKLSLAEAQKRQRSQISNDARLAIADVGVPNDGDADALAAVLAKEWAKLQVRASGASLNADEMLDVVDPETNTVQCSMRRADVKAQRLCYRATYIFVKHRDGGDGAPSSSPLRLYVQRRSTIKDYCPGQLDPVFGGCVGAGESYEENATRELEEEMGVKDAALTHLFTFFYPGDGASGPIWGDCWEAEIDADPATLQLQPEEVDEVMLMTPAEIIAKAESATDATPPGDRVTPDSVDALRRYVAFREEKAQCGGGGPKTASKY